jgi:putative glycosyltransferase (TIGR04372 family)
MLCKLGLAVIRVGSPNSTPLPQISSLFFDYANYAKRTSRLDIFLPANCQFAISTMSGPDAVALAAGRPVLYLDLVQYHLCFAGTGQSTWVPAILKDATDCHLSLGEVFEQGAGRLLGQQAFIDKGITIELSSPLLIRDYVENYAKEFLSGTETTLTSIDQQDLYRKLFHRCLAEKSIAELAPLNSKLSSLFLARHGEWFLRTSEVPSSLVAEVDELQG